MATRPRFQFSLRLAILLMALVGAIAAWRGWVRYAARLDQQYRGAPPDPYAEERRRRDLFPQPLNQPPLPPRPTKWPDE